VAIYQGSEKEAWEEYVDQKTSSFTEQLISINKQKERFGITKDHTLWNIYNLC
jgi:Fe-S cluster biosynthesis and repair protein YggX